jgi:hypothetical protein
MPQERRPYPVLGRVVAGIFGALTLWMASHGPPDDSRIGLITNLCQFAMVVFCLAVVFGWRIPEKINRFFVNER